MALALPIAERQGAALPVTAAAVALTGAVGANLVRPLMDALAFSDPIAWGLTAAATAHGLGTAALSVEPEALPFAGLGYVLCGVAATVLASVPAVQAALLALAGGGGVPD